MITQILAALDGSEPAARAAVLAADLAARYGAVLHLVHVVARPAVSKELAQFAELESVDTLEAKVRAAAQSLLANAQAQAGSKGVQRFMAEVLVGDPAAQLVDYARERGIDLIVLGPTRDGTDSRPADGQCLHEGQQRGGVSGPHRALSPWRQTPPEGIAGMLNQHHRRYGTWRPT